MDAASKPTGKPMLFKVADISLERDQETDVETLVSDSPFISDILVNSEDTN